MKTRVINVLTELSKLTTYEWAVAGVWVLVIFTFIMDLICGMMLL